MAGLQKGTGRRCLAAAGQGEMDRFGQGKLRALRPQRGGTRNAQTLGRSLAYVFHGGDVVGGKRADAPFPEMRGERHQSSRYVGIAEHDQRMGQIPQRQGQLQMRMAIPRELHAAASCCNCFLPVLLPGLDIARHVGHRDQIGD